jgi:hypothetical protein
MDSDLTSPKMHELLMEGFYRHQDGCDMETIGKCVRLFVDSSFFLGMGLEPKKKFAANILTAYTKTYCKNFDLQMELSGERNVDHKVSRILAKIGGILAEEEI